MAKRMLIDAAHPEETRVVVIGGTRLEEFDFESSTKRQVKGNIYLAKVTRVEPSLQAAFIDYGGNRHGFLAFSEIHPDYYRIPVSDRPLGEADSLPMNGAFGEESSADEQGVPLDIVLPEPVAVPEPTGDDDPGFEEPRQTSRAFADEDAPPQYDGGVDATLPHAVEEDDPPETPAWDVRPAIGSDPPAAPDDSDEPHIAVEWEAGTREAVGDSAVTPTTTEDAPVDLWEPQALASRADEEVVLTAEISEVTDGNSPPHEAHGALEPNGEMSPPANGESVETFGGDEVEEVEEADAERRRSHHARHYKIQEVIKRRQIMLVQVAKEERGNKGAALTTYLSLAGRYCVLMPNTNRGGGVSRKITSIADRRRLKDILEELDIPEGMGVIVRTAGAERSKAEIKRDYEYLLRLWNEIRDLTLKSTAPALIYEEGNLIKRSIRDLYTRDLDEVLVEGDEGYKTAKAFMRTLMPSHAKRVQPYRDAQIGLFHRFQIESQIDAIHSPVAQLRSGGYVVINQTEALVAIDVNSGRSTRERNIEETALRTNLEAAEEISRQLRLRDLAGLIVIDFIDMEEHRNQVAVERRLKDALKNDRARIQVGRISPFGLMEMSRQRLRPSLAETSTQPCPHCGGTGFIRSVESTALYVLRSIEEEGIRRRSAEICIYVPTNVALYILNQKRDSLNQIEARYGIKVILARDDTLIPPNFRLERLRAFGVGEAPPIRAIQAPAIIDEEEPEDRADEEEESEAEGAAPEAAGDDDRDRRRRSRRRRRPREAREADAVPQETTAEASEEQAAEAPRGDGDEAERRRRRRGRRGGRVRPRREEAAEAAESVDASESHVAAAEQIEVVADGEPDADASEMPPELETWSAEAGVETASFAALAGETVEPIPTHEVHAEIAEPPSAEAEPGIPFAASTEQVLEEVATDAREAEHQMAPAPRSEDDVRTVTEKPTNPRRGWWQRLIQP